MEKECYEFEPAFPTHPDADIECHYTGLTKREYFVGLILQGMMAADYVPERSSAAKAVTMADYLIEELERKNG